MTAFLVNRYLQLIGLFESVVRRIQIIDTRMELRSIRRGIIRKKGGSVVNRKLRRVIKAYARRRFGSRAYWPGVALAAELRGEYLPGWIPFDYFYFDLEPRLNPKEYANIGDIRTLDHKRFGDFAIEPLVLYVSDNFYDADFRPFEEQELLKYLAEYDKTIVLKQEFGWGGKQVRLMHSSEFRPEQLQRGVNYIIQPFLKQHKILHDLYPDSVNTFRVKTFRKKDGSVEVLFTFLRFGIDGKKVDNTSVGGHCLFFDSAGNPAEISLDESGLEAGRKHKNTGFVFADLKIPMFQDMINICKSTHRKYPHVRLVGWDIAIDESGSPRLIEWNTQRPSFDLDDAVWGPFFPDDSEF